MPEKPAGKRTPAQRRALNKYQKENYVVCAAKLKKEDAEKLRAALEKDGQTVNSFFTACALDYLDSLRPAWEKTLSPSPAAAPAPGEEAGHDE